MGIMAEIAENANTWEAKFLLCGNVPKDVISNLRSTQASVHGLAKILSGYPPP